MQPPMEMIFWAEYMRVLLFSMETAHAYVNPNKYSDTEAETFDCWDDR